MNTRFLIPAAAGAALLLSGCQAGSRHDTYVAIG